MKIILNLTLVTLFFLQTTIGQDINYKEITQIVVGDDYTDEDVQIIKEEVEKSKKKKALSKLGKTKKYINSTVEINGREINKSCADSYIAIEEKDDLVEKLYQEIQDTKKRHKETKPSQSQVALLNKKILQFNELNKAHNINIDNYKMCLMSHREVRNDFDKIVKNLYEAYAIKKDNVVSRDD